MKGTYLVRKTECQDNRHDNLEDQNYITHYTVGQTQDSYFDQRHYKPIHQRELEDLEPSGYFKGQADLHTGNVLDCYHSHWYNGPPKIALQEPQNTNVQFSDKGLPN